MRGGCPFILKPNRGTRSIFCVILSDSPHQAFFYQLAANSTLLRPDRWQRGVGHNHGEENPVAIGLEKQCLVYAFLGTSGRDTGDGLFPIVIDEPRPQLGRGVEILSRFAAVSTPTQSHAHLSLGALRIECDNHLRRRAARPHPLVVLDDEAVPGKEWSYPFARNLLEVKARVGPERSRVQTAARSLATALRTTSGSASITLR
jgi:hypothetical protein